MSIKSNAELIRDETVKRANTAVRVGGNLVEISNDLISKQIEIEANTAKTGFTNALVAAAPSVAANCKGRNHNGASDSDNRQRHRNCNSG